MLPATAQTFLLGAATAVLARKILRPTLRGVITAGILVRQEVAEVVSEARDDLKQIRDEAETKARARSGAGSRSKKSEA